MERGGGSTTLSDQCVLFLSDKTACTAALFALFVHGTAARQRNFLNTVAFSFNNEFADSVKKVKQTLNDELNNNKLEMIAHIGTELTRQMSDEQRQMIVYKLEQLLVASDDYDLMDYACLQLIRRKLKVEYPIVSSIANTKNTSARARKAKTFDAMGSEFALLLSLMVEASGASPDSMDEQFKRVLRCYTIDYYPRRLTSETGIIKELEAAFETLSMQPQSIRHAFVQHCIEIMQHDGIVAPAERALLDLFAASLDCEELIAA